MELADLPFRAKQALRPAYLRIRTIERWIQYHLGMFESEAKIERDAQRFWNAEDERLRQHSHWRGAGIFQDDARWMTLGQEHRQLYEKFARMRGITGRPKRIVDWGCGGGADALHFAPLAQDYVGIDISQDNLDECKRLLASGGLTNFTPVLIRTDAPEDARTLLPHPCDLFLCIGVFEILPTPEYGYRVLEIARDLLADDGMAIIQIKYVKDSWLTRPKRFGYRRNFPVLTTYPIDEFWSAAEARGLKPQAITLQPYQPLIGNGDYAFFCLTKEGSSVN